MDAARHAIGLGFSMLIGAAVFWGLVWLMLRSQSLLWRRIAARYGALPQGERIARKVPETIVIVARTPGDKTVLGRFLFRQHAGADFAIHETGLALKLVPPFGLACPPMFIPFDAMTLAPTSWMLWRDPYALRMRGLDGLEIIIGRKVVHWLQEHVQPPA
jgi:hypothetical protein